MKLPDEVLFFVLSFGSLVFGINTNFDHFVFAQQWPTSVCVDARSEHKCQIPDNVKSWTVHGLWPTEKETEGPDNCNDSWTFNYTKIESLKTNLTAQWPNLYTDTNQTEFWAHEWSKHGTCATSVKATGDEYLYFRKGLQLNTEINLDGALKENGIVPSNSTGYSVKSIETLLGMFYDTTVSLSCTFDKHTKRSLLLQVEVCLAKDFTFTHCHISRKRLYGESCDREEPVYIIPLPNTHLYFKSYNPRLIQV